MTTRLRYFAAVILLILNSCVTPYDPEIVANTDNILVVEGTIQGGEHSVTTIKLSRTVGLDQVSTYNPEAGATVQVEEVDGGVFLLSENEKGLYEGTDLPLVVGKSYRLRVKTREGKVYLSQPQEVLVTPPIDELSWEQGDDKAVRMYVSTHDANNKTWYYRWEFKEDWEFTSAQMSNWTVVNNALVERPYSENIYYCWKKDRSKRILVANSSTLQSDVIHKKEIHSIARASQQISVLYRMQVTQFALSARSFEYWQNMQKNSENSSDIFGPQPSDMSGNLICESDPTEKVLGYVEAVIPTYKEMYIDRSKLNNWAASTPSECVINTDPQMPPITETVSIGNIAEIQRYLQSGFYLTDFANDALTRLFVFPAKCVDCRLTGTKNKPEGWPNSHL